ncbi:MAG: hypothetical protein KF799_11495 [Bdellovibrionales bacterium]|nr:hypothetical protein [Bdellovibrionales bacterium]
MTVTTTRRYSFKSVHALHVGLHRERTHGHEYALEVSFENHSASAVDEAVESLVLKRLHGHELGGELDPATGEVLVEWIHRRLRNSTVGLAIVGVALQETRKNRFVSSLSEARFV